MIESIVAGVRSQIASPGAAPRGTNEWSRRTPSGAPNPVVLVHGGFVNQTVSWQPMARLLSGAGYQVFSLNYGQLRAVPARWAPGALHTVESNAGEVGEFIKRVLDATGGQRVDVVAQSFGTLSTNHFAKYQGGESLIDKFIAISPLWDGTDVLGLDRLMATLARRNMAAGLLKLLDRLDMPICTQVLHGSEYLASLREDGILAPKVHYTNITTRRERLLTPYTTAIVEAVNSTNVVLQDEWPDDRTDHFNIAMAKRTHECVLRVLSAKALPADHPVTPAATAVTGAHA